MTVAAEGGATTVVDTTTDDALGADDATALLERLARREVSADELRTAALARAHAAEPLLGAVATWVDGDERVVDHSADDAPLHGIPTVVKDNEDLAGYPTSQGSLAVAGRPARASSPWVAQYLRMGARPLAKTTLPEFGLTASTESLRFGATRNPWDTSRSAGGSSGGSAALVAAGVVPVGHANDGGGSIRIPAAACGLVGMKPSRGRLVDRPDLERLPVALAVQGVLTRSVRDTAAYLAAAERLYRNPALPPVGLVRRPAPQRLRVGLVDDGIRGLPVSADTQRAVRGAGELCERLGHHVEELAPPVHEDFGPDFLRYWAFLAYGLRRLGPLLFGRGFRDARTEPFTRELSRIFARRPDRLPPALRRLRRTVQEYGVVFERYDVLLSPVVAHPAPPIGYLGPDVEPRTHLLRLLRYASFTPLQNVVGAPAVSLPLGRTPDGRPIGVQVAGPVGGEARLLSLALELEEASPFPRPRIR